VNPRGRELESEGAKPSGGRNPFRPAIWRLKGAPD
jgi:hypothetical protein